MELNASYRGFLAEMHNRLSERASTTDRTSEGAFNSITTTILFSEAIINDVLNEHKEFSLTERERILAIQMLSRKIIDNLDGMLDDVLETISENRKQ